MGKRAYWLFGSRLTIHADEKDSDGRYDLIEGWFPAGMQTPLHRHHRYQEQLFVLEGEFTVWVGEEKKVLRKGESAIVPMGVSHCIAATGGQSARGLVTASPSGFAYLLSRVGEADTGESPPEDSSDLDLFERISAEIGDEILGPPGMLPGQA